MDALMRAQVESIAAQSATNACDAPNTSRNRPVQRNPAKPRTNVTAHSGHKTQPTRVESNAARGADPHIAESLAPVTAELDSIREQL
eukprot:4679287-Pleurochrysis_carterae.AAC.1